MGASRHGRPERQPVNPATRLPIQLDRNSPVPLYFQVAQRLESLIESGDLATGTRLENEIDLADQLGLSRPTMRRAIEYLVDRGRQLRTQQRGGKVPQVENLNGSAQGHAGKKALPVTLPWIWHNRN